MIARESKKKSDFYNTISGLWVYSVACFHKVSCALTISIINLFANSYYFEAERRFVLISKKKKISFNEHKEKLWALSIKIQNLCKLSTTTTLLKICLKTLFVR